MSPGGPPEGVSPPGSNVENTPPGGEGARRLVEFVQLVLAGKAPPPGRRRSRRGPGSPLPHTALPGSQELPAPAGLRVAYAAPRHSLFPEVRRMSRDPAQWYEWQPRRDEQKDLPPTCRHAGPVTDWIQRGYRGIDFCHMICGWRYIQEQCPYHAQRARPERVIFILHQHLTAGHPLRFEVMVGDENPMMAFTRPWMIPGGWILPPGLDPTQPLTEMLSTLRRLADELPAGRHLDGPALLDALGGPDEVAQACQLMDLPPAPALLPDRIALPNETGRIPYAHLYDLFQLLRREARRAQAGGRYPPRVVVTPGSLTLLLRHNLDEQTAPRRLIWLDATGRPDFYRTLFGRPVQVLDAQPRLQGRIFQVTGRLYGKSSLEQKGRGSSLLTQAEDLMEGVIDSRQYRRPALVSFQGVVRRIRLSFPHSAHYFAARGTNTLDGADALFILGAPQLSHDQLVHLATMIYFERDEAFDTRWSLRDRPYEYADEHGQGRAIPTAGFWHDPQLQTLLEISREDELLQAVHRARPANHPVDIWLITSLPVDGLPPSELITHHSLTNAPPGVQLDKWAPVERLLSERDTITIHDLTGLGLSINTAYRYLDWIASQDGWVAGACRTNGRGKPCRQVSRRNNR